MHKFESTPTLERPKFKQFADAYGDDAKLKVLNDPMEPGLVPPAADDLMWFHATFEEIDGLPYCDEDRFDDYFEACRNELTDRFEAALKYEARRSGFLPPVNEYEPLIDRYPGLDYRKAIASLYRYNEWTTSEKIRWGYLEMFIEEGFRSLVPPWTLVSHGAAHDPSPEVCRRVAERVLSGRDLPELPGVDLPFEILSKLTRGKRPYLSMSDVEKVGRGMRLNPTDEQIKRLARDSVREKLLNRWPKHFFTWRRRDRLALLASQMAFDSAKAKWEASQFWRYGSAGNWMIVDEPTWSADHPLSLILPILSGKHPIGFSALNLVRGWIVDEARFEEPIEKGGLAFEIRKEFRRGPTKGFRIVVSNQGTEPASRERVETEAQTLLLRDPERPGKPYFETQPDQCEARDPAGIPLDSLSNEDRFRIAFDRSELAVGDTGTLAIVKEFEPARAAA